MMKREALEQCLIQWQRIHNELVKMSTATLVIVPTLNQLKYKALRNMGVSDDDYPINECYMCEYTLVDGVPDCLVCPLKGYAWERCEGEDSFYTDFCEAYDSDHFEVAADYAQEIIDACDRALEDLDSEEA